MFYMIIPKFTDYFKILEKFIFHPNSPYYDKLHIFFSEPIFNGVYLMIEYTTLNMLKRGQSASIVAVNVDIQTKQRLEDLGIVPDTAIVSVMKSPLGDPVAYLFRGAVIALRSEDSEKILVKIYTEGVDAHGLDS